MVQGGRKFIDAQLKIIKGLKLIFIKPSLELHVFVTMWMELEDIMANEINKGQKDK